MLSFSQIVQVRVNPARPVSAGTAFSTGLILAPTDGSVSPEERVRLFSSVADMIAAGFAESDPATLAAQAYFAADPAPDRVLVGLYTAGTNVAAALRRIMQDRDDFYGVCCCETAPARIQNLADDFPDLAGAQTLFLSALGDVEEQISPAGLIYQVHAAGSRRIVTVYAADIYAAAAVMGTAMGLSRVRGREAFALCYREVPGMEPTDLTESEAAALKALNGNVYVTRGQGRRLLENGAAASGARFDEVLSLDRIAADLRAAAVELLTGSAGKLPQTDETSALFINRFTAVLAEYAAGGILAPGKWRGAAVGSLQPGDVLENGYRMWADAYDTQSDEDRAAHRAMPIHVALRLAGSVETMLIEVDVGL